MNKTPVALLATLLLTVALAACQDKAASPSKTPTTKPALTVTAATPQALDWPLTIAASGNIAAWQEAIIGAELSNYRSAEVRADVGDRVREGDMLALSLIHTWMCIRDRTSHDWPPPPYCRTPCARCRPA